MFSYILRFQKTIIIRGGELSQSTNELRFYANGFIHAKAIFDAFAVKEDHVILELWLLEGSTDDELGYRYVESDKF